MPNVCAVPDCVRPRRARGWCTLHYRRWKKHGEPYSRVPQSAPIDQRFWAKVDPCRTDGCALWVGAISSRGYGTFSINRRTTPAHHFLVGKPPEGLVWDHVKTRGCTHRNCVWPEHLELVTNAENVRRGPFAERTHCPKGHPYDEANAGHYNGRRYCRACNRIRIAAARAGHW